MIKYVTNYVNYYVKAKMRNLYIRYINELLQNNMFVEIGS